jgi:hypothetical protein
MGEELELRLKIFVLAVIASVVLVPAALAGGNSGSTSYGYPTAGNVQPTIQKGAKAAAKKSSPPAKVVKTGTLPFTGLDLVYVLAGGVLLLGTGLALRTVGRS